MDRRRDTPPNRLVQGEVVRRWSRSSEIKPVGRDLRLRLSSLRRRALGDTVSAQDGEVAEKIQSGEAEHGTYLHMAFLFSDGGVR